MVSATDTNPVGVLCTLIAVSILGRIIHHTRRGSLPPGPKGYPLIGNMLDMPSKQDWMTFNKWGEQYGKIYSITVLGRTTVILNSAKIAKEILEEKSSIYSDRPILQMAGNLVGWRDCLALMPYGDRFQHHRRLLHAIIGSKASIRQFSYIQQVEAHRLLYRVLAKPENLARHIRQSVF